MFQSLIGILQTNYYASKFPETEMFQSLIGILQTEEAQTFVNAAYTSFNPS